MVWAKSVVVVTVLIFVGINCLQVIFQDCNITYINKKYFKEGYANIRRYKRNGDYYFNVWGTNTKTFANNVTINIIMTEFLHNEYRRSFIEFHYKFCDFINDDALFGKMLVSKGIVCPLPKGEHYMMNMSVQSQNFPNKWPFEKGGADIDLTHTETRELLASGYVHAMFKHTKYPK